MRRVLVFALLFAPSVAMGQELWQNFQNTNGYTGPVNTSCFLYATAGFDVQCYTPDSTLAFSGSSFGLTNIIASGSCSACNLSIDTHGRVTSYSNGAAGGTGGGADPLGHYVVTQGANAPVNAVNLGAGTNGVEQQTVSAGVATVSQYTATGTDIQVGAASGGGLRQYADFTYAEPSSVPQLAVGISAPSNAAVNVQAEGPTYGAIRATVQGAESQTANLYIDGVNGPWLVAHTNPDGTSTGNFAAVATFLGGGGFVVKTSPATAIGVARTFTDQFGVSIAGAAHFTSLAGATSTLIKTDTLGNVSRGAAGTDYQAPLTACTDYVSTTCQTGATDIGGTNGTTTVIGIENNANFRGKVNMTEGTAPGTPSIGTLACGAVLSDTNLECVTNSGTNKHLTQNISCSAHQWASSSNSAGLTTCTQPGFPDVSGSLACSQSEGPFTGDVTKSAGSCSTQVIGITDGTGGDHITSGAWGASSLLTTDSLGDVTTEAALICSQIPAAGTCTPAVTTGSTGAYLSTIQRDAKGWVTGVTTSSSPMAGALVYSIYNTIISMGQNQSALVMPFPGSATPIVNTAAAGTAVGSTLAANWGSSSQSPPTFALVNSLGSVSCSGDITFYSLTGGTGSITLVSALYYVDSNPFTPSNWHLIASGNTTLTTSASNFFRGIAFSTSNTTGLKGSASSLLFVMYRSDTASTLTLGQINANIICELGS